jgi:hypothetical protein
MKAGELDRISHVYSITLVPAYKGEEKSIAAPTRKTNMPPTMANVHRNFESAREESVSTLFTL